MASKISSLSEIAENVTLSLADIHDLKLFLIMEQLCVWGGGGGGGGDFYSHY